jgi:predicted DsbA family dithiol-disulfide isomerase
MSAPSVSITEFTDPTCPFAFSASGSLLALRWFYGEQLSWQRRLVVLSESSADNDAKGFTAELLHSFDPGMRARFGMPITTAAPPKVLVARPADEALKTVQLIAPERTDVYFRALQIAWFSDRRPIDEREVQLAVAAECGIDADALAATIDTPEVAEALEADKAAARSPLAPATGPLDHKLADSVTGRRYTCPSLEIVAAAEPGRTWVAPGMQNLQAYETLLANAEPNLVRAAPAESVEAALRWAPWPLAEVEIAQLMDKFPFEISDELAQSGATERAGYWSFD